jgi:hypothetical protein
MKKNNAINDKKQIKLKEEVAFEKISHISDLLEYKFALNATYEINKKEYSIYIEDEEIFFVNNYKFDELISCDVDEEAHKLRRGFCMCIALDEIKEYEEQRKGSLETI